jgi:hypothetical protein
MADNNSDASNDNQVKMVPESDLITLKKALEGKVDGITKDYEAKLAESKTSGDTHYQNYLKEKNSHEELEKRFKDFEVLPSRVEELTKSLEAANAANKDITGKHTELKSYHLKEFYGVPDDRLSGKTLDELDTLENALKVAGVKPRLGTGFDRGDGNGTSRTKDPVQECADELAAIRGKKTATA